MSKKELVRAWLTWLGDNPYDHEEFNVVINGYTVRNSNYMYHIVIDNTLVCINPRGSILWTDCDNHSRETSDIEYALYKLGFEIGGLI